MNDNSVSLFKFHSHDIRVVMIEGQHGAEPWFVAADVCRALGMDMTAGTHRWLTALKPDEKHKVNCNTYNLSAGNRRGNPNTTIISESGLYKLVMRSDKPAARALQDWVTREVLPSIRKDGGYILGEEKVQRLHLRWSYTGEMTEEELVFKAMRATRA